MTSSSIIIRCPSCGTKNRLPRERISQQGTCGKCHKPLPPVQTKPVVVTTASFSHEVLQSPVPVLVDFWAEWCGPCRMIAPELVKLADQYAGLLKVAKVDSEQNPELSSTYQVQSIPTLLLVKDGHVVDRAVGALPLAQLQSFIQRVL